MSGDAHRARHRHGIIVTVAVRVTWRCDVDRRA